MFSHAGRFNSDRSKWDTSMVTKMSFMFNTASKFDQDISSWRVFNVVLCSTVR
jgi:surface protein